ncbi:putative arginyl-tRNA synthetase [Cokeromyces recurvatus]|uniref:putative arginyl-tRNA synthetase n=1 Tax=Cokeromyces recurvatus TaxID=90255 RepID=UPI00221F1F08|nr:putative arginyl-tRNA synthetase [Cokeromyces recurvatus]KAI7904024.1 putative arginyl-tRNA synthetase [Cokeromyces recurvatus]
MTAVFKFKQSIANQLSKLTSCPSKDILTLMRPSIPTKGGNMSISLPKLNFTMNAQPNIEAKDILNKFELDEYIQRVTFENNSLFFKFRETEFAKQVLQQVYQDQETYGWAHIPKPVESTVLVDYSSPNIAKPFHAGHLRSTIIGNFIKQIHEALGYQVIGINYLGDWGKQYGLLAIGFERYGDESKLLSDPIHHLYEIYVKINAEAEADQEINKQANNYFKRMEEGDPVTLKQWERFRNISIQSLSAMYERLNVKFDVYSGESQVNSYIPKVIDMIKEHPLSSNTPENALVIDLEKYNLGTAVIQRADGTSLYATRDLASLLMRKNTYPFQKAIYVVGSEQAHYFKQLFQIAELIMSPSFNLQHIQFGRIKGMSTRKGTVVFLEDILDTVKERILEYMKKDEGKSQLTHLDKIADQLGTSAILIQDMKSKREKDYKFSLDRMTDPRGDTGVYLQYAHARAYGIEQKSGIEINPDCDFSLLKEKEAMNLIQSISQFPEIVEFAFSSLEPSTIVNYLFKLSNATNAANNSLRVKDMDIDIARARMLLFWSARITLKNGLHLLGIKAIDRM